jgi:hypothetical protein
VQPEALPYHSFDSPLFKLFWRNPNMGASAIIRPDCTGWPYSELHKFCAVAHSLINQRRLFVGQIGQTNVQRTNCRENDAESKAVPECFGPCEYFEFYFDANA